MSVPFKIDGSRIWINDTSWNEVTTSKSTRELATVVTLVVANLKRDGEFFIDNKEKGVQASFHRVSDFEAYLTEVNNKRQQAGLDPVEY